MQNTGTKRVVLLADTADRRLVSHEDRPYGAVKKNPDTYDRLLRFALAPHENDSLVIL